MKENLARSKPRDIPSDNVNLLCDIPFDCKEQFFLPDLLTLQQNQSEWGQTNIKYLPIYVPHVNRENISRLGFKFSISFTLTNLIHLYQKYVKTE